MKEIWKSVAGYERLYKVSNLARVRRMDTGKILRPSNVPGRYMAVALCQNGIPKTHAIHTLVLTAFKGPRPSPNHECLHFDGDNRNNRPRNLRWGTRLENKADSMRLGEVDRGSSRHNAKLSEHDIPKIRALRESGATHEAIAKAFGVTACPIWRILSGRAWRHV